MSRQKYTIKPLTTDNVVSFTELVYAVYGYTHEHFWMYQPDDALKAVADGRILFFVAEDEHEQVKGCLGLMFPYPAQSVGVLTTLLTSPDIRGIASGLLFKQLSEKVHRKAFELSETSNLRAMVSSEVTVHQVSQRLLEQVGFVPCGIFLAWVPGWAGRMRSFQSTLSGGRQGRAVPHTAMFERKAETVSVAVFKDLIKPYNVCAPRRFADLLKKIYEKLNLQVGYEPSAVPSGATEIASRFDYPRSLGVVDIVRVGADTKEAVFKKVENLKNGMLDLIHVYVPLSQCDINDIVDALVDTGFQYCTLIPQYSDGDVLVLQYLNGIKSHLAEEQLYSKMSKEIFRNLA